MLTGLLTEVGRLDPLVVGGAGLVILTAALFACVTPARMGPLAALRHD